MSKMKLDLSWSSSSPMPLPSRAGIRWFDIEGKLVIVTVIGVYLEASTLSGKARMQMS